MSDDHFELRVVSGPVFCVLTQTRFICRKEWRPSIFSFAFYYKGSRRSMNPAKRDKITPPMLALLTVAFNECPGKLLHGVICTTFPEIQHSRPSEIFTLYHVISSSPALLPTTLRDVPWETYVTESESNDGSCLSIAE
jgi:hypothetical protein